MTTPRPVTHTRTSNCSFCESNCGVIAEVDPIGQRLWSVKGDKDDPSSAGFVCPKSQTMIELEKDPDLLRTPLRRKGGDFEEVDWDEALDEIVDRTKRLQKAYGANSIATYFGHGLLHNPGAYLYAGLFANAIGSVNVFSTSSVDHAPKLVSCGWMFGNMAAIPVPDVDRTDFFLILGANPVASGGSLFTAPGIPRRLKELRARGGRLVVIDPRRTETAEVADQYFAIRPASDACLLLAMVHVAFQLELVRLRNAETFVRPHQLRDLIQIASCYSLERASEATGIAADDIHALTVDFFAADRAVCYSRIGTCHQKHSTLASWLIDVLNLLSGNLDREGGAMFPHGVIPSVGYNDTYVDGQPPIGKWRSRVKGYAEIGSTLPASTLADEILTPGDGQVRALFTLAANPASSIPNGGKTIRALRSLELMVSTDIYLNESARLAHFVLPALSPVYQSSFPTFVVPFMVRNYGKWSAPLLEPPGTGQLADWQIQLRIVSGLMGRTPEETDAFYVDELLKKAFATHPKRDEVDIDEARRMLGDTPGPDRLYDLLLRTGTHGDFFGAVPGGIRLTTLQQHPHGLDLGPMTPHLKDVLKTPDRMIDLVPDVIAKEERRFREASPERPMVMVGRRHVRGINSWTNNLTFLVKGRRHGALLIHPHDATALGIAEGDRVCIRSKDRSLVAPAQITADIMAGVVSLPHGYGQGVPGTRMKVASGLEFSSYNDVSDADDLDEPSATPAFSTLVVTLEKVASASDCDPIPSPV